MLREVLLPATLIWAIIVMISMFEMLFRVQGYQRVLGPAKAAWLGAAILNTAILLLTAAFLHNRRGEEFTLGQLAIIGLWWAGLWLLLEFPFQRRVLDLTPRAWLARYAPFPPQPMFFVLLMLLCAPLFLGSIR